MHDGALDNVRGGFEMSDGELVERGELRVDLVAARRFGMIPDYIDTLIKSRVDWRHVLTMNANPEAVNIIEM